jgi:hypothetical protein
MLFYKGFRYSEVFQKILQPEKSVPYQPFGRPYHPVRTPICPLFHQSGRRAIPSGHPTNLASSVRTTCIFVRTLHCIEKLLFHLASIRTSQQPVRTPLSIRPSFKFFPCSVMGRLMQPSQTCSYIRQESQFKHNRPNASLPSSGRQSAIVRTRVHLIWKLRI